MHKRRVYKHLFLSKPVPTIAKRRNYDANDSPTLSNQRKTTVIETNVKTRYNENRAKKLLRNMKRIQEQEENTSNNATSMENGRKIRPTSYFTVSQELKDSIHNAKLNSLRVKYAEDNHENENIEHMDLLLDLCRMTLKTYEGLKGGKNAFKKIFTDFCLKLMNINDDANPNSAEYVNNSHDIAKLSKSSADTVFMRCFYFFMYSSIEVTICHNSVKFFGKSSFNSYVKRTNAQKINMWRELSKIKGAAKNFDDTLLSIPKTVSYMEKDMPNIVWLLQNTHGIESNFYVLFSDMTPKCKALVDKIKQYEEDYYDFGSPSDVNGIPLTINLNEFISSRSFLLERFVTLFSKSFTINCRQRFVQQRIVCNAPSQHVVDANEDECRNVDAKIVSMLKKCMFELCRNVNPYVISTHYKILDQLQNVEACDGITWSEKVKSHLRRSAI